MASRDVGHLRAVLDAETERFNRKIEQSRKATNRLSTAMRKSKKSFDLASMAMKRFAPLAVAYAMGRVAIDATRMGKALTDASKRTGFSVETLRALQMAGKDAGVTVQTTTMALQRFNRRVGEIANTGKGELAPTFDQLKISIRDTGGNLRNVEDILEEFTRKLNKVESASQRAALAQKAFDSEGVAFGLQVLSNVESLKKLTTEIDNTGRALDTETLEILSAWDVFLGKLADRAATLGAKLTATLVDPLVKTRSELERESRATAERFAPPPGLEAGPIGGHHLGAFAPGDRQRTESLGETVRQMEALDAQLQQMGRERLARQIQERDELDRIMAEMAGPRPESAAQGELLDQMLGEAWQQDLETAEDGYSRFSAAIMTENEIIETSVLGMTSSFASHLSSALMTGKMDFAEFARSAVASIVQIIAQQLILNAIMASPLGGLFGAAKGAVVPGGVETFAQGGVIHKPTLFAMGGSGQFGLMGEAGSEAIMPLRRDSRGRLGVSATGGAAGAGVVVNVTNNAQNSRENDARLGRTIADQVRAAWNAEARRQIRPGGTLNPIGSNV